MYCLFVLFYVLFVGKCVLLPSGDIPIAVKCIISYINYYICCVFDGIQYYIIAKHNEMAPIKDTYKSHTLTMTNTTVGRRLQVPTDHNSLKDNHYVFGTVHCDMTM